jgi:hypothetical protein
MKVIAWSQNSQPNAARRRAEFAGSKEALLQQADGVDPCGVERPPARLIGAQRNSR